VKIICDYAWYNRYCYLLQSASLLPWPLGHSTSESVVTAVDVYWTPLISNCRTLCELLICTAEASSVAIPNNKSYSGWLTRMKKRKKCVYLNMKRSHKDLQKVQKCSPFPESSKASRFKLSPDVNAWVRVMVCDRVDLRRRPEAEHPSNYKSEDIFICFAFNSLFNKLVQSQDNYLYVRVWLYKSDIEIHNPFSDLVLWHLLNTKHWRSTTKMTLGSPLVWKQQLGPQHTEYRDCTLHTTPQRSYEANLHLKIEDACSLILFSAREPIISKQSK
jgi:hypothetical protein